MSDGVKKKKPGSGGVTRRSFLKGMGLGTMALPAAGILGATEAQAETTATTVGPTTAPPRVLSGEIPFKLSINGKPYEFKAEVRTTLLDALRNWLDLTGTKLVCDRGTCGACTVLMNGKQVNSCMVLAIDAQGSEITTIEGLSKEGQLHPIQAAFVEADAQQCGFCTPGMVMACKATFDKHPDATMDDIREGLSGNICRCGTYNRIFEAAMKAKSVMAGTKVVA